MKPEDLPLTLKWITKFVDSINRVVGDLYGWDILEEDDPLRFVLHLKFFRSLEKKEVALIRDYLKLWCKANDAEYRKTFSKGYNLKSLIVVKGLGPLKDSSPFD